eukprot:Pompholyxophrys_punicea_v1_NODE_491_length_1850_cov_25.837326.p2 type:complete len:132 gc:universal NODE_491_length_1850_cov_25.837326:958-563(-)
MWQADRWFRSTFFKTPMIRLDKIGDIYIDDFVMISSAHAYVGKVEKFYTSEGKLLVEVVPFVLEEDSKQIIFVDGVKNVIYSTQILQIVNVAVSRGSSNYTIAGKYDAQEEAGTLLELNETDVESTKMFTF